MILENSIERLLLIAPTWIGDAVMATVVYRAARRSCPNATITIAARSALRPLLEGAEWFDHVTPIEPSGLFGPIRAGRGLASGAPEAVILLPGSFRSALVARSSGAPCRIGTARDARRLLLTHPLPHPDRSCPISAVEHYARIAAACFGDDATSDRSLSLHLTGEERDAADRLLHGDDRPLLLLVPGANRADKRWPVERFAEAANALVESHAMRVVVCGGPDEAGLTATLAATLPPGTIDGPAEQLSLGTLKALTARAALVISNDTGPRHIAAAMGAPIVSLFGPTDHRWTTLPGVREHTLLADPFLPEDVVADHHPERCAIDHIEVTDVIAAGRRLLDESTAAAV
jgi:heptosyltransferase-2